MFSFFWGSTSLTCLHSISISLVFHFTELGTSISFPLFFCFHPPLRLASPPYQPWLLPLSIHSPPPHYLYSFAPPHVDLVAFLLLCLCISSSLPLILIPSIYSSFPPHHPFSIFLPSPFSKPRAQRCWFYSLLLIYSQLHLNSFFLSFFNLIYPPLYPDSLLLPTSPLLPFLCLSLPLFFSFQTWSSEQTHPSTHSPQDSKLWKAILPPMVIKRAPSDISGRFHANVALLLLTHKHFHKPTRRDTIMTASRPPN